MPSITIAAEEIAAMVMKDSDEITLRPIGGGLSGAVTMLATVVRHGVSQTRPSDTRNVLIKAVQDKKSRPTVTA